VFFHEHYNQSLSFSTFFPWNSNFNFPNLCLSFEEEKKKKKKQKQECFQEVLEAIAAVIPSHKWGSVKESHHRHHLLLQQLGICIYKIGMSLKLSKTL
ncbi:hypothetical protein CMV_025779, partial [Castanea mollissima]